MAKFDVFAIGTISRHIGEFEGPTDSDALDAAQRSDAWQDGAGSLCCQCSRRVGDFSGFELKAEKMKEVKPKHPRRPRPPGTPKAKR